MKGYNPYRAPKTPAAERLAKGAGRGYWSRLQVTWAVVFLLNLAFPLYIGWHHTAKSGRVGMFVAAFLLLGLGYWTCGNARAIGRTLVGGGILVGLGQLFLLPQMTAGFIGLGVGHAAGLVDVDEGSAIFSEVNCEAGGFLVTLTTGGLLMTACLFVGPLLRGITPGRWWADPAEDVRRRAPMGPAR
jgi:hypothetical protein